jgi:hypothetical protein
VLKPKLIVRYKVTDTNDVHVRVAIHTAVAEDKTFAMSGVLVFDTRDWITYELSLPFEVGKVRHELGGAHRVQGGKG